jgi:hypothetical protein
VSLLLERLDDLILSCTESSTLDVDLRDYVERSLIAKAGRAEAARERTENRSRALRQRIREKAAGLPLSQPMGTLVGIVERRMSLNPASARTIRDELEGMRAESRSFGTETAVPFVSNTTYRST